MENLAEYNLQDERILKIAIELAPELFSALSIANHLEDSVFPIKSGSELENILTIAGDENGVFEIPNVRITKADSKQHFPKEFLPIADRFDLIRKIYMAIIIAHQEKSRRFLNLLKSGKRKIEASHPFDLEAI